MEPRLLTPRFAALLAAHGTFGLANSTYFLFPKYLQVEFGADPATIGVMAGAPWLTSVLCVPFTGPLIDRFGRRRFVFTGAVLLAIGCAMLARIETVGPAMLAARVVQGVAFSFFFVGASTLAADLAPMSRLSQALGWFGATMVVTNALSPAIAEPWAEAAGWTPVFWATCVCAGLSALLTTRLGPPTRRPTGGGERFGTVVASRPLRAIWTVSALAGVLFGGGLTFSGPWALDSGLQNVSGFFVAYALAAALVRFTLGGLADRSGRLRVAIFSMVLYTLCPLALIDVGTIGLVVPGIGFGLAHGLYYPALNAVALERSDARVRATVMALYNGFFNVGFTLGSIGLGPIAQTIGYPGMFAGSAVCGVWACGLLVAMARRQRG